MSLPVTNPVLIFSLVLFVILFAPFVSEKLKLPNIIVMILAGIILGEHGIGVLTRDSSFELYGTVGMVYIMFLAGIEMDITDFKKNRKA
jgi:Kef-type K+ transport system membrane component KefB